MKQIYDLKALKKPTNLSINSELLSKARKLKLNLSATLESALVEEVRKAERLQWLEKNKKAIEKSNKHTEKNGLFSDSYRVF